MATKKASSSKRVSTKKPAAKAVEAPVVTVVEKSTFGEKVAALRPGALIAEFLGTFVLAGTVISLTTGGVTDTIAVALILAILVVVFGAISGAHLNPAISIAQWLNKKIDGVKAGAYIIAQVVGALAAFGIIGGLVSSNFDYEAAVTQALAKETHVEESAINEAGGVEKYLNDNYGMTIDVAAQQLGVDKDAGSIKNVDVFANAKGKEYTVVVYELLGAIIFGLGVGYAVFGNKKSQLEAGLAVGIGLLAGLTVGGANAILNPAVAAAIGAFEWTNPLASNAGVFWWPVLAYFLATSVGMTLGVTAYRLMQKDTK